MTILCITHNITLNLIQVTMEIHCFFVYPICSLSILCNCSSIQRHNRSEVIHNLVTLSIHQSPTKIFSVFLVLQLKHENALDNLPELGKLCTGDLERSKDVNPFNDLITGWSCQRSRVACIV